MTQGTVGLIGFVLLGLLLLLRVPIGTALLMVGAGGLSVLHPHGLTGALDTAAGGALSAATLYLLCIVPLFNLLGQLGSVSGMSRDLYDAARVLLGPRRGGVAMAAIVGCAGFSALTGSSLAATATLGRIALPDMHRAGYDDSLACGTVAAGGTLGILVPPSIALAVYAVVTGQAIEPLYVAGLLPALLLTGAFIIVILMTLNQHPERAPIVSGAITPTESRAALRRVLPVTGIVSFMIVGIVLHWFDAVFATGLGALLALAVCVARGKAQRRVIVEVLAQTLRASATSFWLVIGAFAFIPFLTTTGLPGQLSQWVLVNGYAPVGVLLVCVLLLILLSMVIDGLSILVLFLPMVLPTLIALDVDLIWFGIATVITLEMGLIAPPFGINLFVVQGLAPRLDTAGLYRGVRGFWLAMLVCLLALLAFPQIVIWLPGLMLPPP